MLGTGTAERTLPCSQALDSDKTPEQSYLAEEKVTLAHISGEFQSIMSVKVWQRATRARAAGVWGGTSLFP